MVILNMTIGIFYTIGSITAPWVLLAVGYWKYYMSIVCVLQFFVLAGCHTLPESFQLLAARGYAYKSVQALFKVAQYNKKELGRKMIMRLTEYTRIGIKEFDFHKLYRSLHGSVYLRNLVLLMVVKSYVEFTFYFTEKLMQLFFFLAVLLGCAWVLWQ